MSIVRRRFTNTNQRHRSPDLRPTPCAPVRKVRQRSAACPRAAHTTICIPGQRRPARRRPAYSQHNAVAEFELHLPRLRATHDPASLWYRPSTQQTAARRPPSRSDPTGPACVATTPTCLAPVLPSRRSSDGSARYARSAIRCASILAQSVEPCPLSTCSSLPSPFIGKRRRESKQRTSDNYAPECPLTADGLFSMALWSIRRATYDVCVRYVYSGYPIALPRHWCRLGRPSAVGSHTPRTDGALSASARYRMTWRKLP